MNPEENAKWAAIYLKKQLKRYNDDWCKATAAYNAGSFTESTIIPGKPRNLKYVNLVKMNVDYRLRHRLSCGEPVLVEALSEFAKSQIKVEDGD
jgi:soluble lytic murein transglycosylase-like protein